METIKKTDWVQLKNYRIYLVISTIGIVGIVVHIALIPFFYWLDLKPLALLNVFSALMWISGWFLNKRGKHQQTVTLLTVEVIMHTAIVVPIMGWHSGFQYYLIAAIPFTLFNNTYRSEAIILISIILCILFLVLEEYTHDTLPLSKISEELISIVNQINIVISFTAICVISYYFRLASLSLENELEKQAGTDPLTGLLNRRRMQDYLNFHERRATCNHTDLSIIFVDIDHFKKFNDTYGHSCGDYILSAVADFLKSHLRYDDAIARWGGEEFLIMLPNTDINGARIIAEKIREAVAEERFHLEGQEFAITMTFGLSQHQINRPIEDCLKMADLALYKGKEAGRNLVMW